VIKKSNNTSLMQDTSVKVI